MITKSATDKNTNSNGLTFTANARAAWEHVILSVKNLGVNVNILMPSYIGYTDREGSGVFDPVRLQDAEAVFYQLNHDLSVNVDDFARLASIRKFNIALIIHYFGFCRNDMTRLSDICKENQIILVEDCAHAFHLHNAAADLGNYGDFSFYSLHKFLPSDSGGVLKNNTRKIIESELSTDKGIALQDIKLYATSDIKSIVEKRRHNYDNYYQKLSGVPEIEIMFNLRDGEIPQTFPIKVKNGFREKLYFFLMEMNLPTTALYYRLIDNIKADDFPISHNISQSILNLPVHQDTDDADIDQLCSAIKVFFEQRV